MGSGTLLMQPWAPTACDTPGCSSIASISISPRRLPGPLPLYRITVCADLEQDYRAMSQMIFGETPAFDGILELIVQLEQRLNG